MASHIAAHAQSARRQTVVDGYVDHAETHGQDDPFRVLQVERNKKNKGEDEHNEAFTDITHGPEKYHAYWGVSSGIPPGFYGGNRFGAYGACGSGCASCSDPTPASNWGRGRRRAGGGSSPGGAGFPGAYAGGSACGTGGGCGKAIDECTRVLRDLESSVPSTIDNLRRVLEGHYDSDATNQVKFDEEAEPTVAEPSNFDISGMRATFLVLLTECSMGRLTNESRERWRALTQTNDRETDKTVLIYSVPPPLFPPPVGLPAAPVSKFHAQGVTGFELVSNLKLTWRICVECLYLIGAADMTRRVARIYNYSTETAAKELAKHTRIHHMRVDNQKSGCQIVQHFPLPEDGPLSSVRLLCPGCPRLFLRNDKGGHAAGSGPLGRGFRGLETSDNSVEVGILGMVACNQTNSSENMM